MMTTKGLIIAIALIPVTMGIALMVCVQLHPLRLDRWRPATLVVAVIAIFGIQENIPCQALA